MQGQKFSAEAEAGRFWELTVAQRKLAEDYDGEKLDKALNQLLEQKNLKPRPYRGAGAEISSRALTEVPEPRPS